MPLRESAILSLWLSRLTRYPISGRYLAQTKRTRAGDLIVKTN
jgi:hypothetical protein